MEKNQTNAKTSLVVKLTQPNPKIIQDWSDPEKETIHNFCKNKIRDFTADEFTELEVLLIRLQRRVGISKLMADDEIEDVKEFLAKYFADFATDEISHAVDLAIVGKLVILDGKGKEVGSDHYQEFSSLYLTRILKAYQSYRGSVVRKYYEGEDALNAAIKKAAEPPRDKKRDSVELVYSNFDAFKRDIDEEVQITIALHLVYDTLIANGLISYDQKRMDEFREAATSIVKQKAHKGDGYAKNMVLLLAKDPVNNSLEHDIKGLAVKAYFRKIIGEGKDIRELLKIEVQSANV